MTPCVKLYAHLIDASVFLRATLGADQLQLIRYVFSESPMGIAVRGCRSMAALLAGSLSLAQAGLAVPIQAADGISKPSASTEYGGPRRPGLIQSPAGSSDPSSSLGRGRPVPGVSGEKSRESAAVEADASIMLSH